MVTIANGEAALLATIRHLETSFAQENSPNSSKLPKELLREASFKTISSKVNMTVGDIYGPTCSFLPVDLIASSLGKTTPDSDPLDFLNSYVFLLISNISLVLRQIVI